MRHRNVTGALAAVCVAAALAATPLETPVRAQTTRCELDGIERIVAVGDVHGAYDRYVEILRSAGVLDARLRWSGGRTHLVQIGDVVDRGPDSRKTLDLLKRLSEDARRGGGAVHVLLGNHEIMRMLGDLRYVVPGEYEAFVTSTSDIVRRRFLDALSPALREQLEKDTPLGQVEMRVAFGHDGEYGEWLRKLNVAMRINGIVFVHGGISPALADLSCDAINGSVQRELTDDIDKTRAAPLETLSAGENGPVWYRGLAEQSEDFAEDVDRILSKQKARAMVIGHTLAPERRIRARFGRKVIQIDTGMQAAYVKDGRASALEIRDDVFTAIYTDSRGVVE
jgi:hypothetical protein